MDVELRKWGNSIGFRIPRKIADSFGLDEKSTIELIENDDTLVIKKKNCALTLQALIASIPPDFQYPDDIADFVESKPIGREII